MADKKINHERLATAMEVKGLNGSAIASQLGVSRTIVSDWIKGRKFPSPKNLLELGELLGLRFGELVVKDMAAEPVVAYRHRAHVKANEEDAAWGRSFARAAQLLVPYLPYSKLDSPQRFIAPSLASEYLEEAARETRSAMGVVGERIEFQEIIGLFSALKAVLVPVLWGTEGSRANGFHLYLPETQTTFVYLNLDVQPSDFKFWMLHEYAHAKARGMVTSGEEERFADAFAATVLFPRTAADSAMRRISRLSDKARRLKAVLSISDELGISPVTIAKRIDESAQMAGATAMLGGAIHPVTANFHKKHRLVSETLLGEGPVKAGALIRMADTAFHSRIYHALKAYLADHVSSESMVTATLGIGPIDAKAVLDAFRSL